MELVGIHPQDSTSKDEASIPGVSKPKEKSNRRKTLPPPRSEASRTTLSDVSNLPSNRRPPKLAARDQGSEKIVPLVAAGSIDDYVARLIKENSNLSNLLEERNKTIEMNNSDLQKLRINLQKANQQNWHLVQRNSQMLAELNLGKDRLKSLQHELSCITALLKATTAELKEAKRLNEQNKQAAKKLGHQKLDTTGIDPQHNPPTEKKDDDPCRKRRLRSQSLVPNFGGNGCISKEKDERQRRSLRRRSSNLKTEQCQPAKDLFEIEDIQLPIRSTSGEAVSQDMSFPSSVHPVPIVSQKTIRDQQHQGENSSSEDLFQGPRRSSIGRPVRKAAERVKCYKEVPLNLKMRRDQQL